MQLITEPTWLECSVTERSSAHSEKHHNTGSAQVYLFTHDECMSLRATSHCVFDSAGRQGQSWAYFFVCFFFCSESLCIYTKKNLCQLKGSVHLTQISIYIPVKAIHFMWEMFPYFTMCFLLGDSCPCRGPGKLLWAVSQFVAAATRAVVQDNHGAAAHYDITLSRRTEKP